VPTVARSFKHGITTESSMSSPACGPDGASIASVIDFIVSRMNPVNQELYPIPPMEKRTAITSA